MINYQRVTRLVFILALISLAGAGIQSSPDLFQKALRLERSEGDLRSAIAVYKQIVEKNDDEALAAQAQFRIGICLEKLGRAEARAAFQLVVDRYPRQTETVREARDKIAVLAGGEAEQGEIRSDFGLRRIWSDPGADLSSRVSPDGKTVAFSQSRTGNLAVFDFHTLKTRVLRDRTKKKDEERQTVSVAWSSDGSQLACLWRAYHPAPDVVIRNPELYIYNYPSGDCRQIPLADDNGINRLLSWAAGDSRIFVSSTDRRYRGSIGWLSVRDGTHVKVCEAEKYSDESLPSPGGEGLAIVRKNSEEKSSLSFFDLKSQTTETIMSGADMIRIVGWTSAKERFYYICDTTGRVDLLALPTEKGRPAGEPELILRDIRDIEPLGITMENSIVYNVQNSGNALHAVGFDFDSGAITEPDRIVSRPFEDCELGFDLSPDGSSLAYLTGDTNANRYRGTQRVDYLSVFTFKDGRYRDYGINDRAEFGWVKWLDKQTIGVSLRKENREEYRILNVVSGAWTFTENPAWAPFFDNWKTGVASSNGKYLYRFSSQSESKGVKSSLARIDQVSKEEKEIWSVSGPSSWFPFLSPDKKSLALTDADHQRREGASMVSRKIFLISLDEGTAREAFVDLSPSRHFMNTSWCPDSRGFVVSQLSREIDPKIGRERSRFRFLALPVNGRPVKQIEYEFEFGASFGSHRTDGRHIVYQFGRPYIGEIWIMENALKTDR